MTTRTAALVDRLNRDWEMINRETDPQRKEHLEDWWIELLRKYERAVDASHERTAA